MPTYAYRCRGCGHEFDRWMSITSSPKAVLKCPACKARRAVRVFAAGVTINANSRVEYPLRDWQLPPDPETGKSRIVTCAKEHRDLARRYGYEMNQGYTRDFEP